MREATRVVNEKVRPARGEKRKGSGSRQGIKENEKKKKGRTRRAGRKWKNFLEKQKAKLKEAGGEEAEEEEDEGDEGDDLDEGDSHKEEKKRGGGGDSGGSSSTVYHPYHSHCHPDSRFTVHFLQCSQVTIHSATINWHRYSFILFSLHVHYFVRPTLLIYHGYCQNYLLNHVLLVNDFGSCSLTLGFLLIAWRFPSEFSALRSAFYNCNETSVNFIEDSTEFNNLDKIKCTSFLFNEPRKTAQKDLSRIRAP
jgi:hypothetical protein